MKDSTLPHDLITELSRLAQGVTFQGEEHELIKGLIKRLHDLERADQLHPTPWHVWPAGPADPGLWTVKDDNGDIIGEESDDFYSVFDEETAHRIVQGVNEQS